MTLENRVAVITGATGGLGSVVTKELAALGANLALLDLDPDKLNAVWQPVATRKPLPRKYREPA